MTKYDLDKVEEQMASLRQLGVDQLVLSGAWSDHYKTKGYCLEDTPTFQYLRKNLLTDDATFALQFKKAAAIQAFTFKEKPSVLIHGETGTGKETFARSFAEPGLPFVGINCTALPEYLMESELFGHVQGAFTGAIRDRDGLFHTAGNGVLFLDEIGDMPIALQPKLLRVLQERRYRPVGSNSEREVKCRVVCATHQKPSMFRRDLYDRLSQYFIEIPPLRDREDDMWLYLKARYPDVEFIPCTVREIIANGNYRALDNFARALKLKQWCDNDK